MIRNKRLAWESLVMFCALNGHQIEVTVDEAVSMVLAVASHDMDEEGLGEWLQPRLRSTG